jgi:RND family efflux transporter MFP subunit
MTSKASLQICLPGTERADRRDSIARRLALVLALAVLAIGCGTSETAEPDEAKTKAVDVHRQAVVETELVVPVFGTGTIAAHKKTEIGPRVDGIIEEVFVKVGDRVQAGDPLFRTRQVHYQIRVDEAGQSLHLANAELEHTKREHVRIQSLHTSNVASEGRMDEAKTAYDMAAARQGKARAAHARALQELEDTTVRAPYPGAITHRYVDEGAMMRTMMSANSPVVQLMKMDIVAAIIQIPEIHLSQVHIGTPAQIKVDGIHGVIESEVYILNDLVDPVSRAFEVRLPIVNEDLKIKPGLFAQAELMPEPRLVKTLDRGAVLGVEGSRYVFLEEDGVADRRAIKARDLDATRFEILDGLAAGEFVLTGPNLRRLSSGTSVAVEIEHANR